MEPILINRARTDRETLKRAFIWTSRRGTALLLAAALLMVILATIRVCLVRIDVLSCVIYGSAIAYLVFAFLMPTRFAKLQLRRIEENFQSDHVDTVVEFYPEEYVTGREGNDAAAHTRYEQLKTVPVTGGLILLWTKGRQFVILDPARFENGTEADFWRLMNEKCPKAVPKGKRSS